MKNEIKIFQSGLNELLPTTTDLDFKNITPDSIIVEKVSPETNLGKMAADMVEAAYSRYRAAGSAWFPLVSMEPDNPDTHVFVALPKGSASVPFATFKVTVGDPLDLHRFFSPINSHWPGSDHGSELAELARFCYHTEVVNYTQNHPEEKPSPTSLQGILFWAIWRQAHAFLDQINISPNNRLAILAPHVSGFLTSLGVHIQPITDATKIDSPHSRIIKTAFPKYWREELPIHKQPSVYHMYPPSHDQT